MNSINPLVEKRAFDSYDLESICEGKYRLKDDANLLYVQFIFHNEFLNYKTMVELPLGYNKLSSNANIVPNKEIFL